MTALKTILIAGIVAYAALLAFLFLAQRKLMYLPDVQRIAPREAGLGGASEIELKTRDGETILGWHVPAPEGRPTLLYFHGNAGNLSSRAMRLQQFARQGFGVLAISYRGYGGSTGAPSEAGLINDARAAYDWLLANGASHDRIILVGESLGSGVAVALAAQVPTAGVLLEAPFASAAEIAAEVYWMFPVRWLMRDPFRSSDRITEIAAPLLIVHGEDDAVIPFASGQALYASAREPKRFLAVPGAGHQPLDIAQVAHEAAGWLESIATASR